MASNNKAERAKILVVDSDPHTMKAYKEAFTRETKYKIVSAASGRAALAKMKSGHFALVILDVMMPRMSGIDVCSAMSRNAKLKKIPVILSSALPVDQALLENYSGASEFGGEGDGGKPIEVSGLTKIKRVLAA
jgi:CheY-like chemotaxis protein